MFWVHQCEYVKVLNANFEPCEQSRIHRNQIHSIIVAKLNIPAEECKRLDLKSLTCMTLSEVPNAAKLNTKRNKRGFWKLKVNLFS